MTLEPEELNASNLPAAWQVLRQLRKSLQSHQLSQYIDHPSYKFRVFKSDQSIVAVCGYRMLETITRGWHCHVHDLAVDQSRRGQGIGRAVIGHLSNLVSDQNGRWIFLDGIDDALGFYEKIGFKRRAATLMKLHIAAQQGGQPDAFGAGYL